MNKIGPGIAEYPLDSNGNYDSYWPSCSNAPLDEILVLGDIRPFPKKEAIGLDVVYIWRP